MLVTLQKLGLTYYGARVYVTLVSLGPSDATELAAESEVPRTKIYDVLKRLKTEKWITVEHTRPITYTPKYPRDILEEKKKPLLILRLTMYQTNCPCCTIN